jgi:hypothetical protein
MNNSIFENFATPQNPMAEFMNEFNQFKNSFKGDPKAEVEKMIKNGQLSQEEFNRYAQMANQIMGMFK